MYLNKFCNGNPDITPIYFCAEWEKTSVTRDCFTRGWKVIDSKLKTMFSHAVLLEMLNQRADGNRYSYHDIWEEYIHSTDEDKKEVIENKSNYTLDEIEAKLSVICVRKKVNFNLDENNEENEKAPLIYNDNDTEDSLPAWLKAVEERRNINN